MKSTKLGPLTTDRWKTMPTQRLDANINNCALCTEGKKEKRNYFVQAIYPITAEHLFAMQTRSAQKKISYEASSARSNISASIIWPKDSTSPTAKDQVPWARPTQCPAPQTYVCASGLTKKSSSNKVLTCLCTRKVSLNSIKRYDDKLRI